MRVLLPDTKFIIMTAYEDERIRRRIAAIGCDAYFEKPLSMIDLQQKVAALLKTAG